MKKYFPLLFLGFLFFALPAFANTRIFLTATGAGNWTVPSDWNSASNTIEAVGGGAGALSYGNGSGGGGGAYSKISNLSLTLGASIPYSVGAGGLSNTYNTATNGGDTWFGSSTESSANVAAKGGVVALAGSGGGASSTGIGTLRYAGGNWVTYDGGGGAAGPGGNGQTPSSYGKGGNGDPNGTGGGAGSTTNGGNGTTWDSTHGIGGGGGANGAYSGGLYGGGSGGGVGYGGSTSTVIGGGQGIIVITYTPSASTATTTYTQAAYRFFTNQNSSTVGPVLAATNASATLTATGQAFRLRMLLAVDASSSAPGGPDAFVLQFANKGTGASCTSTQYAYASITSSTAIAYNTNALVANGVAVVSTSTDPTDGGRTVVEQTYQSSGTFNVTSTIPIGEDGNWDFSLIDNSGAPGGITYCFQAVYSSSTALYAYSTYPQIKTYLIPFPAVSNMSLNAGSSNIILTPNTTTAITVVASTTDPGGAGNISYATGTIYRTSLGSNCAANNANCYQIASSSCAFTGSTSTVTCTANIYYFAQSTGNASSSFPSDSWTGAITVHDGGGYTTTATSTTANVNVLTAINVTTSSINYGTLTPNTNTGSANQTVTIQNAGNSSTTLQVSGTAFAKGANTIATSSQHYATSTFTFGGSESQLSGTLTTISGFILSGPTSTANVQGTIFFGDSVPSGIATGTYTATTTFSAVFSQ